MCISWVVIVAINRGMGTTVSFTAPGCQQLAEFIPGMAGWHTECRIAVESTPEKSGPDSGRNHVAFSGLAACRVLAFAALFDKNGGLLIEWFYVRKLHH